MSGGDGDGAEGRVVTFAPSNPPGALSYHVISIGRTITDPRRDARPPMANLVATPNIVDYALARIDRLLSSSSPKRDRYRH